MSSKVSQDFTSRAADAMRQGNIKRANKLANRANRIARKDEEKKNRKGNSKDY